MRNAPISLPILSVSEDAVATGVGIDPSARERTNGNAGLLLQEDLSGARARSGDMTAPERSLAQRNSGCGDDE